MTINVWKWLTVASIGVLIALLINDSRRDSANVPFSLSPAEASAAESANAGLTEDIEALRAELARLRSDIQTPSAAAVEVQRDTISGTGSETQTLANATRPSATGSADPARLLEQEDLRERQHFAAMDARVSDEAVDPDWSLFASNTISNALTAQENVDVRIGQIDCRSTLCKVEVTMDPRLDLEDLLLALPAETRTTFPRLAAHTSPDDPAMRIVYLSSSTQRLYSE